MLTAAEIIAKAEVKAGFRDTETGLHENLAALVAAIDSGPALSATGLASVENGLVTRSAERIEGLKWVHEYPEIADEQIAAPVILTGLPRSGTTYLQYLFDRDDRFRLIRTWEALAPMPPPGFDPASVAQRKAQESAVRARSRPAVANFSALHLHDDDGSEECHAFLEQGYAAAGFFNLYDVPDFFDFLMDEVDLDAVYAVHRRQLQLLQWKSSPRRWALKYPNHVIALEALERTYPGARFVMTHRDPVQLLASISKMTLALRSARYAQPVDPHKVGRQMTLFVRRHIDRILAHARSAAGERVTHVDYYRLQADAAGVIGEVHERLGLDTPDRVGSAIASWHRDNPKNARGANDYALEQFGIDAGEVTDLFSDYISHFDIPSEREGLARAGVSA
ncbi:MULTISPECIES: sulfotransferase [unclassified Novosphingobium]|uniref:sulfotransferase family protein n=1 Tax=unclassified Novosphingobium TaxID=2644732 RepID=UPI00135B845C|nr:MULTISPECIES: sulfotransferase [unclassified Novosphingobium]